MTFQYIQFDYLATLCFINWDGLKDDWKHRSKSSGIMNFDHMAHHTFP